MTVQTYDLWGRHFESWLPKGYYMSSCRNFDVATVFSDPKLAVNDISLITVEWVHLCLSFWPPYCYMAATVRHKLIYWSSLFTRTFLNSMYSDVKANVTKMDLRRYVRCFQLASSHLENHGSEKMATYFFVFSAFFLYTRLPLIPQKCLHMSHFLKISL